MVAEMAESPDFHQAQDTRIAAPIPKIVDTGRLHRIEGVLQLLGGGGLLLEEAVRFFRLALPLFNVPAEEIRRRFMRGGAGDAICGDRIERPLGRLRTGFA